MSALRAVSLLAIVLWLGGCCCPGYRAKDQPHYSWSYTYSRFFDDDPYWWTRVINLGGANASSGNGTTIAIIGTGVLKGHEDLGTIRPGLRTCVNPPDDNITDGKSGHGTQLAGIAVGKRNGDHTRGVAPDAALIPIKVDCGGGVTSAALTQGIDAAIAGKPDVVLVALGGYPDVDEFLLQRVASVNSSILFVVASAWDPASGPAPAWTKLPNALVVAAMTLDADARDTTKIATAAGIPKEIPYDTRSGDIWAPGRAVGTADNKPEGAAKHNGFSMHGTSPASAMVAGCALLVKEKSPLMGAGLKTRLLEKADDVPKLGRRLNCGNAVP